MTHQDDETAQTGIGDMGDIGLKLSKGGKSASEMEERMKGGPQV